MIKEITKEECKNVDDKITGKITKEEEKKIWKVFFCLIKLLKRIKRRGKDLTENL